MDVFNTETRSLESVAAWDLFRESPHPDMYYAYSTDREGHLAAPLFKGEKIDISKGCITFDNLIAKTPFVSLLRKILKELETAYGRAVDVEFAWDADRLYLLQCRTLAHREGNETSPLPVDIPPERVLFTNGRSIFNSVVRNIEYVVYVDPEAYARMVGYDERLSVARLVGRLNRLLDGKRYALFGPPRWGSNDVDYGVKVAYQDINRTLILGEIAFSDERSAQEASYGTHFFSDLVEAGIVPLGIYPGEPGVVFQKEFFLQCPHLLGEMLPDLAGLAQAVRVIHVPACRNGMLLHVIQNGREQKGMGYFAPPEVR